MSVSQRAAEPQSAPARSRQATRERLVSSGTTLFAARGLHGVTTHDIADGAGVAAGTFYLHFSDKRALFRGIVFDAVARLRERLNAASADLADRPSMVRARLDALLAFAEEHRDVVQVLFSRDHAAAEIESDALDFLAQTAESGLRTLAEDGGLRDGLDPAVTAQALVAMQARVLAWWIEDPGRAPRETVIDSLARLQLHGTEP